MKTTTSFAARLRVLPFAASALVLFFVSGSLPRFGDPSRAPSSHVSPRYIEKSLEETGAPNMVTAVLADYRSYDTLGETLVIFTAGVACLLVIGTLGGRTSGERAVAFSWSEVVDVAGRFLAPFLVLFALYVVVHGHGSPGGGFQGGAILSAALILLRLVRGQHGGSLLDSPRALKLSAAGVLAYLTIGLLPLASGRNVLDYEGLPLPFEGTGLHEAGILGIEVGVFLAVTAAFLLVFESLASGEGD